MSKIASYILSAYSFIFKESLDKLLDVGYQSKNGNPIPSFDELLLIELCTEAQDIFKNEENLLNISGDVIIVGDIHGSLHDLLRILHYIQENKSKVLFLGDYVDRGNFSLECITILFALKVIRPDIFYLIRGNHEFDQICGKYGFKDEILNHHNPKKMKNNIVPESQSSDPSHSSTSELLHEKEEQSKQYEEYLANHNDMDCYKYSESLYNAFISAFSYLPIGAIVNGTTFCIHGGLSPRMETIDNLINNIQRPISTFEESELLTDVVWSDPTSNVSSLYGENPRGRGYLYNSSSVMLFLVKHSMKRIIRGHECVKKGSLKHFNEKLITIFSASSYDKNMGNHSAVLELFQNDDEFKITHFEPLQRLQKYDAAYYKVQPFEKSEVKIPSYFSFHHPSLSSHGGIRMVTNKKFHSIPFQRSQNSFFFHELHAKSHLINSVYKSSSSSMLPSFHDNRPDHSMLNPTQKEFTNSDF